MSCVMSILILICNCVDFFIPGESNFPVKIALFPHPSLEMPKQLSCQMERLTPYLIGTKVCFFSLEIRKSMDRKHWFLINPGKKSCEVRYLWLGWGVQVCDLQSHLKRCICVLEANTSDCYLSDENNFFVCHIQAFCMCCECKNAISDGCSTVVL